MRVDTNGNVGIGITSPSTKLHIDDNAASGTGLLVTGGGGGGPLATFTRDVGSTGTIAISSSGGDPQIRFASSANTFALGTNGSTFEICDNSTVGANTRLSITSAGNVGIGTTSPNAILDISDATNDNLRIGTRGGNMNLFSVTDAGAASPLAFEGSQFNFITGNVGIGTTSPDTNLEIGAATNVAPKLRLTLNDSGSSIGLGQEYGSIQWKGNDGQGDGVRADIRVFGEGSSGQTYMTLGTMPAGTSASTAAQERMRITSGGNVGIGTTTPSAKLEVNGHFAATTKSFIIDNPKTDGRLQYGVVETDEHSVYVRGKSDQEEIQLPEEWEWLVHEDSVTALVTAVGQTQRLFVIEETNKKITVGGLADGGRYNYVVYGTRKDVDALEKHLK